MNLWEQILARVETKVNRHSFYTWFKPTTFVAEDASAVTVRVPNSLFKDWLTKHYSGVITEAMGEMQKSSLSVNFMADSQSDEKTNPGVKQGIRIGSVKDGKVTAFIPLDAQLGGAEEVAADDQGNVFAGFTNKKALQKYVKN